MSGKSDADKHKMMVMVQSAVLYAESFWGPRDELEEEEKNNFDAEKAAYITGWKAAAEYARATTLERERELLEAAREAQRLMGKFPGECPFSDLIFDDALKAMRERKGEFPEDAALDAAAENTKSIIGEVQDGKPKARSLTTVFLDGARWAWTHTTRSIREAEEALEKVKGVK